jgi:hypothetical protein
MFENFYNIFFLKNKHMGILRILIEFNRKILTKG